MKTEEKLQAYKYLEHQILQESRTSKALDKSEVRFFGTLINLLEARDKSKVKKKKSIYVGPDKPEKT